MHRDMSYELDGVFSSRGAGELVAVRPARTRIARSPGLTPVGRLPGGDVRNISPEIAHKMSFAAPRNITAHRTKSLALSMGRDLSQPMYHEGSDLADDDADMPFEGITLPVIGEVSLTKLAVIAGAGFLAYKLFRK